MTSFHYESYWPNSFNYRRFPKYLDHLLHLLAIVSGISLGRVKLRNGLVFKIGNISDLVVLKEVFYDKCYEQKVRLAKADKIIVDVGAGFGDFAIDAAKRFPKAEVFAFEPDEKYFHLLLDNISLNKIKNIFPIKRSATGKEELFYRPIDFLKIDCEGCEFGIIKNLNLNKFKKITLEFHESIKHNVDFIDARLKKNGFSVEYERKDIQGLGMLWAKR